MRYKHHHQNRNLHLYFQPTYNNMPVNQYQGPLIEEYLSRLDATIQSALKAHRRVVLIRVDLRLPLSESFPPVEPNRSYMTRFLASLTARIENKGKRTRAQGKRWHDTEIKYAWCKEFSAEHRDHYHVAILLNGDTFRGLGSFDLLDDSLYTLIIKAWASALGIDLPSAVGLAHFADRGATIIKRGEPYDEVFYWLSYFAKSSSKSWGDGKRAFDCSRGEQSHPYS